MRLDLFLVNHQYLTRNKAQQLIEIGLVSVDGKIITKPSFEVSEESTVAIQEDRRVRWVSRSAEKLAGFLEKVGSLTGEVGSFPEKQHQIQIEGAHCLDVGSSTGGFTQVLLEYGASHVDAVDVGTDQLHASLRADPRITSYEKTDIRDFARHPPGEGLRPKGVIPKEGKPEGQGGSVSENIRTPHIPPSKGGQKHYNLIVCDASFISLYEILPSILSLANIQTNIVLLYKPQFEVGREQLRKTGVPKDEKVVAQKMKEFEMMITENDCTVIAKEKSSLIGEAGNQEWIYWIRKN